jgi:hypothetical protein
MYNMELNLFGFKVRVEVIVLFLVLGMILGKYLLCGCAMCTTKEGMASLDYQMSRGVPAPSNQNLDSHQGLPVPLPDGRLAMFSENKQSPTCTPSTYSGSLGGVCITQEQMNWLNRRGGNRSCGGEF